MNGRELFYYPAYCLLAGLLLVRLSIVMSRRFGLVDQPGERKVHTRPMPRAGGVGIFLAFHSAMLFFMISRPEHLDQVLPLFLGGLIVFSVGLMDDIYSLGPGIKLAAEFAAVLFLLYHDVRISFFIGSYFLTCLITAFWIVGITNAFNLLDNMDGLSGGTGCLAAYFFFCVFLSQGDFHLALLAFSLSMAILGFLRWNFSPARTFMGDCGSLYIGFNIAALSVMGSYVFNSKLNHLPVITPLVILSIPLYDTISVIIIRLVNGKPVFQGDQNHFSHRLVRLGFNKRLAVLLILFLSAQIDLSTLLLSSLNREQAVVLLLQMVITFFVITLIMFVSRRRIVREEQNGDQVNRHQET
ncbi:MAG: MraY family glycosyltransferase [Candidatus Wallbacteria bacterium]|nr:MraY family glycosyltransferase [Candidatus Wallbacteria bacterium]